jgi:hypothetical protein
MSVTDALTRIAQIQTLLAPLDPAAVAATGGVAAPADFSDLLAQSGAGGAGSGMSALLAPTPSAFAPLLPGSGSGGRMLQIAAAEVGQGEQPPGSNDSPRIAQYRMATAGSGVGPWCAYFASWAAQQAGVPLGEVGQGFGSVDAVAGWAQRTGRWTAAAPGVLPQPGDLIVWGASHIGIVESVGPDGSINTIEGNSSNAVSRRSYGSDGGGATGYVRVG